MTDATREPSGSGEGPRPRRRDGLRTGLLFNLLGQVAMLASTGLISILLARHYGATLLGQWSVATVYANLVGTVTEGGLGRLLMRDAARDPKVLGRALGRVVKGRVYLGAISAPVCLLAAAWTTSSGSAWALVPLLIVARWIEGIQSSYQSALFTLGDFRTPNLLETARRTVRVLAIVGIVALDLGLAWVAITMVGTALLSHRLLVRATREVVTIDYSDAVREQWRDAFWFWLNGVLFWVNSEISLLMIAQLVGEQVTGLYAAALRLVTLFLIVPRAMSNSLIPRFFRSAASGDGQHRQLGGTAFVLSGLGALVAAECWLFAAPVIDLIYGDEYRAAGPVLSIAALFLMLNFMRIPGMWFLSTSDRVRMVTVALGLGALANVLANLLLIPGAGAVGAAWAAVISEALLGLWALGVTVRLKGPRILLATAFGLTVGGSALLVGLALPRSLHWLWSASISSAPALALLGLIARRLLRGWNPLGMMGPTPARA
jgi:PST family polysaccharide transporter